MLEIEDKLFLKFCDFIYNNSGIRFDEKINLFFKAE